MISSTLATLECAAQVRAAASTMHSTGSPVMALSRTTYLRRVLGRRQRVEQDVQREQHQAEPDRDPSEVLDPAPRADAECDQSDDEEHRSDGGDVERQHLDDEGRSDIRPEHDRQRGHQGDQALARKRGVISPVAVLLCSTAVSPIRPRKP